MNVPQRRTDAQNFSTAHIRACISLCAHVCVLVMILKTLLKMRKFHRAAAQTSLGRANIFV